ncbi:hypothetical protein NZD88_19545 [Chryseobacterium antibioticum]|uniref:Uncharacterized protein n=1 Tax=Chryseobacterium pyrolae TaxID=2987481 RepID=A0ABT2IM53_9FLAO|nr:hypothetical protein [Chryseobacterium pyrolae]MCT2409752.1 hypothetical protein [Chryseobacterium pyrolae]
MGSIYIGIVFVFIFLTLALSAVSKQKKVKFYIPFVIYFIMLCGYLVKAGYDLKEYNSYNNEVFSNVTGIGINNQTVNKKEYDKLFEELKFDEFTWVNHPIKRKEYFVSIHTKQRMYKFKIWDTYNQGVLVFRINKNGKEFVTNRNDKVIYYLNNFK